MMTGFNGSLLNPSPKPTWQWKIHTKVIHVQWQYMYKWAQIFQCHGTNFIYFAKWSKDPTTRTVATHLFSWAKKNKQWGSGSLKKWLLFLPQKNGFPLSPLGGCIGPLNPFLVSLCSHLVCSLSTLWRIPHENFYTHLGGRKHKATWIDTWSIWATKKNPALLSIIQVVHYRSL